MEDQKKEVHQQRIPVRWVDLDAFNHVNTAVYFTYFEQARIDWWATTQVNLDVMEMGPVVINAQCHFIRSITFPETILVKMFASPPGRSSYQTYYEIYSANHPEILYAEGQATIVWVDRKASRSIPLPEIMRRHLPQS